MEIPVIHLFTHDSIGLGEDGPTHQPIEQLASLRAMPHLDVIRPADANEVAEAWRLAIERTHNPVALVLTRQNVPVLDRTKYASAEGVRKGGYVLADCRGRDPELILHRHRQRGLLALGAHETAGRRRDPLARRQPALLGALRPPGPGLPRRGAAAGVTARVAIEEASPLGWERYVGDAGEILGMTHLRPVGAVQGRRGGVRVHAGEDRRGGARGRERAAVKSTT